MIQSIDIWGMFQNYCYFCDFSLIEVVLIILTCPVPRSTPPLHLCIVSTDQSTFGNSFHTLEWVYSLDTGKWQSQEHFLICIFFQTGEILVWGTRNSHRGLSLVKKGGGGGQWRFQPSKTPLQCASCELTLCHARVLGTSNLFVGGGIYSGS